MSSIKDLKKEINNLTEAFASDGFGTMIIHPEKREEIIGLISDAVVLRNNQVHSLNHPDPGKEEVTSKKEIIHQIRKDFFDSMDELFQSLSKISLREKASEVSKEKEVSEES